MKFLQQTATQTLGVNINLNAHTPPPVYTGEDDVYSAKGHTTDPQTAHDPVNTYVKQTVDRLPVNIDAEVPEKN